MYVNHLKISNRGRHKWPILALEPNVVVNRLRVAHHSLLGMADRRNAVDVPCDNVGGSVGIQVEDGDLLASGVGDGVPAWVRHARALNVGSTKNNIQYEYA